MRLSSRVSALSLAAFGFLSSLALSAQDQGPPELLKDKALVVTIRAHASGVSGGGGMAAAAWDSESLRYTVPGTPAGVRIAGSNIVVVIQVTPFEDASGLVTLLAQGQVWIRRSASELSYRTAFETLKLRYGERVYFYPLGRSAEGTEPLRVEFLVERFRDVEARAAGKALPAASTAPAAPAAAPVPAPSAGKPGP